jgi:hypothetical protein
VPERIDDEVELPMPAQRSCGGAVVSTGETETESTLQALDQVRRVVLDDASD